MKEERHVDDEYKNNFPGFSPETPRMEVDQGFISMNQVFMLLYLLQNYQQQKNFENGFYPNCSHLHNKVVEYIRCFYPGAIIAVGLGENQDTCEKRINSWEKGYI